MTIGDPGLAPASRSEAYMATVCASAIVALLTLGYAFVYPIFIAKVLCFAIFAMAFNFLLGYVGLMSFGHAMFFGGASYATAWLLKNTPVGPGTALLAGVLVAVVLGTFVGFVAIRRKGIYFAMITLAMAQMFFFLCGQSSLTGGEDGIQGVPRGRLFNLIDLGDGLSMYVFVSVIFLLTLGAVWRIVNSPFGNVLKAIREHEPRAISLGYNVDRYKLGAFMLSSGLAGIAGSVKAILFQLASLTDVSFATSGEIVFMTMLGGIGTLLGPLAGSALVVGLETVLATSELPVPVVLGAIFILCVMVFRRGIVGEIEAGWANRSRSRSAVRPRQPSHSTETTT